MEAGSRPHRQNDAGQSARKIIAKASRFIECIHSIAGLLDDVLQCRVRCPSFLEQILGFNQIGLSLGSPVSQNLRVRLKAVSPRFQFSLGRNGVKPWLICRPNDAADLQAFLTLSAAQAVGKGFTTRTAAAREAAKLSAAAMLSVRNGGNYDLFFGEPA